VSDADLAALGIAARRAALVERRCSVVELIAATAALIEQRGASLHALASPFDAGALDAAAAADRRLASGAPVRPLEGTPFLVKDNIAQDGRPVHAGTPFELIEAGPPAPVVARLLAAGAILVGRAAMSPWALGGTGADALARGADALAPGADTLAPGADTLAGGADALARGAERSPHGAGGPAGDGVGLGPAPLNVAFPDLVPGGSSSGSATAVAGGLVPFALGSDTGGSIRMPAGVQEIVGLRPTRAAVSPARVFPVAPALDVVGPLTRDADDLLELIGPLLGDAAEPGAEVARARVAFCPAPDDTLAALDGAATSSAIVVATARRLADAGARVEEVALPGIAEARAAGATLLLSGAARTHRDRLAATPERFSASSKARLTQGASFSDEQVARAERARRRWAAQLSELFDRYDALLLPAFSRPIALAGRPETVEAARDIGWLMLPFSIHPGPSLVAPVPRASAAVPGAVQLVAKAGGERTLARLAARG
jgi:Asp-tRNA(Asn)/Glu-tRNA(Gln) amidotransferase A subunit family amidase